MNEKATSSPAYLIAHLHAKDQADYFQRYGYIVMPLLKKYQAQVLVASATARVLESQSNQNWTVLIQFPSMRLAETFYNCAEYQPLKALRINELTSGGLVVMVEGGMPALPEA
jgi:uncharacterized protein (DUF1330 family)